ncbi:MAG: hypothetical protein HC780_27205 [Leptolyngbyaceae cyanobacterium CSU_1_3]|nr:hypothetical protein [Leptolyngbyaceae cyanobacterium CSU_1_3]
MPRVGDTIRCEVKINSFARGNNTLLYFFSCDYFVRGEKMASLKSGAGFFTNEELRNGQGVTLTKVEREARLKIQPRSFTPLLCSAKTSFTAEDLLHLSQGDFAACFGEAYQQSGKNPSLRLSSPAMRMLDRVVSVDPTGGAWGLGLIVAEKTLNPEAWYFNCHFKDDFCLPGTLAAEGGTQLIAFYMLYLGLQSQTIDATFQPVLNVPQGGRNRGQITSTTSALTYQIEITEIGLSPEPFVRAELSIFFGGKMISISKNLGLRLVEKER